MVPTAPELDLLRTFAVFAAQLNFTRAAALLHLSQPAVHAHVTRLSESLGVALYRRDGRRLALTAEGRRVAAFARDTTERAEAFVAELRGDDAPRPVCLCAGAGSYVHLLGDALRAWIAAGAAPTRLLTRDREGTLEAVRTGEAHLGVAPVEVRAADLSLDVLGVIPLVLAAPAGHPLAARRSVRLRELAGARLIAPSPDRPHRQALDAALAAAGAPVEVAVEANGWELALRFVELGVGVAVVSGFCRLPPGVVARPLPELPPKTWHLVRRRGGPRTPAQDALRRALLDGCAPWRR